MQCSMSITKSITKRTVSPGDLRFTQDTIACHFKKPHERDTIYDALEKIRTKQWRPNRFPELRVISRNGYLWSADNRRLWVFRKAQCPQITVRMIATHPRLEELITFQSRYRRFSKADFLPEVRGPSPTVPAPVPKDLHLRAPAVMMSGSGFPGRTGQGGQNVQPVLNVANLGNCRVEAATTRPKGKCVSFGAPQPKALVVSKQGAVSTGPRQESPTAVRKVTMPVLPSPSDAQGGRLPALTEPSRGAANVDILRIKVEQSFLREDAWREQSRLLLPGSSHNEDIVPTESMFGWVRKLVFGCFGHG